MERFSERESVLLGYNTAMMNASSSTGKPFRNSDVDFHDVFGGPPRRFSMHEVRREGFGGDDDGPWSGLDEKPVFGDEVHGNRRRLPSADFFNDIFGGDASVNSSPVRTGHDHALLSSPGSRALSPLPLKAEPLGSSSTSLAKFSLPAKVLKGVDFPTFGGSRSVHKQKESSTNGIKYSHSSGSLSRFSSEAIKGDDGSKGNDRSAHQLSSLFKDNPFSSKESPKLRKKDSESSENSTNHSGHFHFSIYKWASKGVPLDLPLRGKSTTSSRTKETTEHEPLAGRCENPDNKESIATKVHLPDSYSNVTSSNKIEQKGKPQSETQSANKDEPDEKTTKEIRGSKEIAGKAEMKTIRSLLSHHDLQKGSDDQAAKPGSGKKILDKSAKGASSPAVTYAKTAKKNERKIASLTNSDVEKGAVQSSPRHSKESNGKSKAKGRVKDFVKMFNHESAPNPKDGLIFRSRSCKWNAKLSFEDETSVDTAREDEKLQMPKANDDLKQSAKVRVSRLANPSSNRDSFSNGSNATVEETYESFTDHFQVKELTQDENEKLGSIHDKQEFRDIDVKIRQWTKGKEGNIRSLLSTLQYVLWAESGWKAVPLMDIIEGNSVKRAYQKALLCLHPDKLQQKGASSHQKYMAEKVFDILQDAWNYFNSLGAV